MKNTFLVVAFAFCSVTLQNQARAEVATQQPTTIAQTSALTNAQANAQAIAQAAVPTSSATDSKKESYSELKADCLRESPALKGIELRKCVKAKKQAMK